MTEPITINVNGPRQVSSGHGCGLTYGPPLRRLPRIHIEREGQLWTCRWIAQNNSYLECSQPRLLNAIKHTLAWRRQQAWPLIIRP